MCIYSNGSKIGYERSSFYRFRRCRGRRCTCSEEATSWCSCACEGQRSQSSENRREETEDELKEGQKEWGWEHFRAESHCTADRKIWACTTHSAFLLFLQLLCVHQPPPICQHHSVTCATCAYCCRWRVGVSVYFRLWVVCLASMLYENVVPPCTACGILDLLV